MIKKTEKNTRAILKLELSDGTKIAAAAYDAIADFCLRELKQNDMIILNGQIKKEYIDIYSIEKMIIKT